MSLRLNVENDNRLLHLLSSRLLSSMMNSVGRECDRAMEALAYERRN